MKNAKMLLAVTMLATAGLTVSSCNKYEEGPKFTVLTKKMRVTNIWDLKETVASNGDVFTDSGNETIELTKKGTAVVNDPDYSISISGSWEFSSNKEKLRITNDAFYPPTQELEIVRLTSTELWLKNADNDLMKYTGK